MNWLALDIGGANLKVADGRGYAQSYQLALWRERHKLGQQIRTAISEAPASDHLAVTMTGELADCFESKAAGVSFILNAIASGSDNRHMRVYLADGRLVTPQVAVTMPQLAAASNWHALARFAGRYARQGTALVIDVGSTTCDVIPLLNGQPAAIGKTDTERLLSGELVYTGVERSPVCGVVHYLPYRGQTCPVCHELFAATRDVYVLLGELPEDLTNTETSDGQPLTKSASRLRMARMVAADGDEFNHRDAVAAAQSVWDAQSSQLATAIGKVRSRLSGPPQKIVLSGHGEFLARTALALVGEQAPVLSLASELSSDVSRSAPAHALAVIAREASGR
jgi:(4-(4-[2-(gamma-L-glutamylamino)ethyl]phenoxymethyl)furan-2-yl)methanamine synthase